MFSLSSRSVSGAIFDVDGTILDSMEMWRTTGSRFLRKCGVTPPPDIDRLMFQITLEEGASLFGEKFGIEGTPEEIKARVLQMVRDDYRYRLSCKPGVVDVIRELYSAGIPLCVATATDRELILPAFERLGLLPFFGKFSPAANWVCPREVPISICRLPKGSARRRKRRSSSKMSFTQSAPRRLSVFRSSPYTTKMRNLKKRRSAPSPLCISILSQTGRDSHDTEIYRHRQDNRQGGPK